MSERAALLCVGSFLLTLSLFHSLFVVRCSLFVVRCSLFVSRGRGSRSSSFVGAVVVVAVVVVVVVTTIGWTDLFYHPARKEGRRRRAEKLPPPLPPLPLPTHYSPASRPRKQTLAVPVFIDRQWRTAKVHAPTLVRSRPPL